jgi:hypothetical protein
MAQWSAGTEASLGESGFHYERHCPGQTFLTSVILRDHTVLSGDDFVCEGFQSIAVLRIRHVSTSTLISPSVHFFSGTVVGTSGEFCMITP